MADLDEILRPWIDRLATDVGPLALFDAHTHIGQNDPDGYRQRPNELLAALGAVGARAAVFPMHEPDGYPAANDAVLEAAAGSGGRLVPYCRVDPRADAVAEARRCFAAGARGIKLHPRAESFDLSLPAVRELVALAHEREAPVLVHAGRGIPALGEDTVRLAAEFPGARMILAHAAISDLAWLWRVLPDRPNVFVDTAWWAPSDLLAVFSYCPPGNVLWASDSPYGQPLPAALIGLRPALQAGLSADQVRGIAGGQLTRILAREPLLDLGPAPGPSPRALDPLIERVVTHLTSALSLAFRQADYEESIALARLACAVGEDGPFAEHFAAVLELLDLFQTHLEPPPDGRPFAEAGRFLVLALVVARTPDVALPALPGAPVPDRAEADALAQDLGVVGPAAPSAHAD